MVKIYSQVQNCVKSSKNLFSWAGFRQSPCNEHLANGWTRFKKSRKYLRYRNLTRFWAFSYFILILISLLFELLNWLFCFEINFKKIMLHVREIIHILKIIHAGADIRYSPILSAVSFLLITLLKNQKFYRGSLIRYSLYLSALKIALKSWKIAKVWKIQTEFRWKISF